LDFATSSGSHVTLLHFFFQAEDGIRDRNVTGVQTCALPISQANGVLDFFIRSNTGNHWPHLSVFANDEVDNYWTVIDFARALDSRHDFFFGGNAYGFATHDIAKLDGVWDVVPLLTQLGISVVALVAQCLPLGHHAQVAVINNSDLDGEPFQSCGSQLLVGHLETAIAVDCPDFLLWHTGLGTECCRNRIAHGAGTTGVDPSAWVFKVDELCSPHLVLPNACDVNGLRADFTREVLQNQLRVELAVFS